MTTAWVLMTAMPPTKGHANLIRFASSLDVTHVRVIVCTQPGEPFVDERVGALRTIASSITYAKVKIHQLHKTLPQNPKTPGFWDMWKNILTEGSTDMTGWFLDGVSPGDYIVASEIYGIKLAEITDAIFIPYDPRRDLVYTKATDIRESVAPNFHWIANEFQHNLRLNVTVFGAESTGKTTLSRALSGNFNSHWFFEWARPYLETVGPEITVNSMTDIWKGQAALQMHSNDFYDKPIAFFDTDLYSTIGYWEQPHWQNDLGEVPEDLIRDANLLKSDLYIITKSNIPFEADPLRYGGDHRESDDAYWIEVAERYGLNYIVVESRHLDTRIAEASEAMYAVQRKKWSEMTYDRGGF